MIPLPAEPGMGTQMGDLCVRICVRPRDSQVPPIWSRSAPMRSSTHPPQAPCSDPRRVTPSLQLRRATRLVSPAPNSNKAPMHVPPMRPPIRSCDPPAPIRVTFCCLDPRARPLRSALVAPAPIRVPPILFRGPNSNPAPPEPELRSVFRPAAPSPPIQSRRHPCGPPAQIRPAGPSSSAATHPARRSLFPGESPKPHCLGEKSRNSQNSKKSKKSKKITKHTQNYKYSKMPKISKKILKIPKIALKIQKIPKILKKLQIFQNSQNFQKF